MPKKQGETKNQRRGRSASPLVTNKAKKQNTNRTLETAPEQSTSEITTPVIMDVDPTPSPKGKEKEVEETAEILNNTPFNVDESNDASENMLNEKYPSAQAFDRPKPTFHGFFPLEDFPGTTPQQKTSCVVDLFFDKYDSFTGASITKHPTNQLQRIIKISFRNKEERDHACKVQLPKVENRTFLPLDITPSHPFIPAQSIKVTEIPLDATVHQIKTVFSKYRTIVKFNMETKNMWQQATITFAENTDFKKLAACNGVFVLNDMVRVHRCDLPKKDILAKSKFSVKLAGLPRFTTGKQLLDIGHMVNALAWIIPKARSNYRNLQHAFFYFSSADDVEAALSNENLTIDGKHVTWTSANAKLCAICSSPQHKASDCPKRRKQPADRNVQNLYQRFQPAQFSNYKAPKKMRGAVNPDITFADATKKQNNKNITPPSQLPPKQGKDLPHNNKSSTSHIKEPNTSWSDDVPYDTEESLRIDQFIYPSNNDNLAKGTKAGGSMHGNTNDDVKAFISSQFANFEANLLDLMKTLAFTVKRVESIEQALNVRVITPIET